MLKWDQSDEARKKWLFLAAAFGNIALLQHLLSTWKSPNHFVERFQQVLAAPKSASDRYDYSAAATLDDTAVYILRGALRGGQWDLVEMIRAILAASDALYPSACAMTVFKEPRQLHELCHAGYDRIEDPQWLRWSSRAHCRYLTRVLGITTLERAKAFDQHKLLCLAPELRTSCAPWPYKTSRCCGRGMLWPAACLVTMHQSGIDSITPQQSWMDSKRIYCCYFGRLAGLLLAFPELIHDPEMKPYFKVVVQIYFQTLDGYHVRQSPWARVEEEAFYVGDMAYSKEDVLKFAMCV